MFGALTSKLQNVFEHLGRQKKLDEDNISQAVREVRMALLEADVHYEVAKKFVKRVKEKALGDALIKSVSPGQQFIKIVHDELVALMGNSEYVLKLEGLPAVVMLCGLQGMGKTTQCAKLAYFLKKKFPQKKILLAALDLQRPAAILQLQSLGKQVGVEVFAIEAEQDPLQVAKKALQKAQAEKFDFLIADTAGRLHIDQQLMEQLVALKDLLRPQEVLFVASAVSGQDAAHSAAEFEAKVGMTGCILTMLDSQARAGAALSIREVTNKPLVFEGVGEKIEDLQPFHPHSMADRILGMGDTINLVKRAQEHMDEEEAKKLEQKMRKASLTYEDYLNQMRMIKKMGSFSSLLKMLPGMGALGDLSESDAHMKKIEAMILSMTTRERQEIDELVMSRRRRIANGSGTSLEDVNKLIKNFKGVKQMMKKMPNMKKLEQMIGGNSWR